MMASIYKLRSLPRLGALTATMFLAACGNDADQVIPGYVEAEYTRLASPNAGRLVSLLVAKGSEVSAGTPLFVLDQDQENASVNEATARLARQNFAEADTQKGKRREEIAVLEAQEQQAIAQLSLAESELRRKQALEAKGFISAAALENTDSSLKVSTARLAELQASLRVARLAAREDLRQAARAEVDIAKAALDQSKIRRDQKSVSAPAAGRIEDTLYRTGEWVPAGSPVVSLLTPGSLKLRFFVSQKMLPKFSQGTRIHARCDGCGNPFPATISYVARSAEFNPPVIYSRENRSRMVFMIEAIPDSPATLSPGLPVDILLESAS